MRQSRSETETCYGDIMYAPRYTETIMKYVYGPVPSRRLGNSLGLDIIPSKTCSFNCIYCQLGRTAMTTLRRESFFPVSDILQDLQEALDSNVPIDFITFSGSGEPTLNQDLGQIIFTIKEMTPLPVAVITNSSLLWREDVQNDLLGGDLLLPSLDAGSEAVFQRINRPHPDLHLEMIVKGLTVYRSRYAGRIWLEIFLVEGINTDAAEMDRIVEATKRIRPDKIQLNTAIRPPAEPSIHPLPEEKLKRFVGLFPFPTEIIADYSRPAGQHIDADVADRILELLKRRPCTVDGMSSSLKIHKDMLLKYLHLFREDGKISERKHGDQVYYSINT